MIKAIETRYKGYRFRSRLEARWAVFLDAAGWDWVYEPEGFDLGEHGRYLPDFRLHDGTWLEIKAQAPTQEELNKAAALCQGTRKTVLFGIGLPDPVAIADGLPGVFLDDKDQAIFPAELREAVGALSVYCARKWHRPGWYLFDNPSEEDRYACDAARSARFEHGECGATA